MWNANRLRKQQGTRDRGKSTRERERERERKSERRKRRKKKGGKKEEPEEEVQWVGKGVGDQYRRALDSLGIRHDGEGKL